MQEQASNFVRLSRAELGQTTGVGSKRAGRPPGLKVRRTLSVKIKKSKPILGIAIEGGFEVSGQLLPRILFVHVSKLDS